MEMKASRKKAQVFLLLAGVLCFFFSPVVLYSAALDEMEAKHPPAFENVDLDNSSLVPEQSEKIIGSISVLEPTLKTDCSFPLQTPNPLPNFFSPGSKPLILRC